MNYTGIKVRWNNLSKYLDYGRMLKLSNHLDVLEYFETRNDYKKSYEDFNTHFEHLHFTNKLTRIVVADACKNNTNFVQALGKVVSNQMRTMFELLSENKTIYVNENGGFFAVDKSDNFIEYNFINEQYFNANDIEIVRWEEGRHYYAKIKNIDVCYNGEQKWNTYDEAYRNAFKYLTILNNEKQKA